MKAILFPLAILAITLSSIQAAEVVRGRNGVAVHGANGTAVHTDHNWNDAYWHSNKYGYWHGQRGYWRVTGGKHVFVVVN